MNWDAYVEELRTNWDSLDPIGRAEKIEAWVSSGHSMRDLGRKLERSESGLRKIRSLLRNPTDGTNVATQKPELSGAARTPANQVEVVEELAQQIIAWMDREQIYAGDRVRIIKDVERRLGELKIDERVALRQTAEGIDLERRPAYIKPDDLGMLNGWIVWLSCFLGRIDNWKAVLDKIKPHIPISMPGEWNTP